MTHSKSVDGNYHADERMYRVVYSVVHDGSRNTSSHDVELLATNVLAELCQLEVETRQRHQTGC